MILERCKSRMSPQTISTWLKSSRAVNLLDDCLTVELKNKFSASYVEQNYQNVLDDISSELLEKEFKVSFIYNESANPQMNLWEFALDNSTGEMEKSENKPVSPDSIKNNTRNKNSSNGNGNGNCPSSCNELYIGFLNPRYTFDNFVSGSNSQLAHAAALSVAEDPGMRYNPLFIYGGVGLGKTHLMQAIGHELKSRSNNGLKICYVSAEAFLNELIGAIRSGTMVDFRTRYRQMDVLMIDDVEFLSEKEGTQEEFFHTFNALFESQKQIILTSDRPPREIQHLEERLRSRFQWGLITDIQPPALETRIAILKKKSEVANVLVPANVLEYIANNIKSNVRLLEGSLHFLKHYSTTQKTDINIDLAEQVLKNIFEQEVKHISTKKILKFVCAEFNITNEALMSNKRSKQFVEPRQVAMYICHKLTKLSLTEIADTFERKDHTTVLHACKKISKRLEDEPKFSDRVSDIIERIKNQKNI